MKEEPNSSRSDKSAHRIVMQYFRGNTLVCELRTPEAPLSVHISPGNDDGDRDAGWRIEAHGKVIDKDIVVAASGTTRRNALTEVSTRWSAQRPELGLFLVDWEAVAVALSAVRAID
jgi:hypothetical protein